MPRLPVATLVALLVAPALAGCALPWRDDGDGGGPVVTTPTAATPEAIRVTFAGRVLDALSDAPVDDAQVRLDLASELPCRQESIIWNAWDIPVDAEGRFGPHVQPAPNSPTYRFWLHVRAPGYSDHVVYVGPEQAAQAANLSVVLHPRVAVEGTAPPATVIAMTGPEFPRFVAANASGAFRIDDARVEPAQLVVATSVPQRFQLTPPATVEAPAPEGAGWALQGVVRREDGSPIEARVVAWNGTLLWSAAVTDEVGRFLLPLPREPAALRIEARTDNDHYGGVLALDVRGPPAAVEQVLVRPRC